MEMASGSNSSLDFADPPVVPPDSPGSSVSTRLQEEYDELLKYAVVVPDYNPKDARGKLSDARGAFGMEDNIVTVRAPPQSGLIRDTEVARPEEDEEDGTPRGEGRAGKPLLPDFQESPISGYTTSFTLSDQLKSDTSGGGGGRGPLGRPLFGAGGVERESPADVVYTATVDQDVGKMETLLDHWCLELKRNVLAEFSQAKIVIEQKSRQELLREKNRHATEKLALTKELDSMKEFLHTYEQTMERKDGIISNLTRAVYRQRDRLELMRNFCNWRIHHNDAKREAFTMQLARQHHERALSRRVLSAWFSVIHCRWRQRVEKACQSKAQEICMQVTADYEAKIASMNEAQESTREEVKRLHIQREKYEEAMKKAFMRGVCALNMEAMSMFHGDEGTEAEGQHPEDNGNINAFTDNLDSCVGEKDSVHTKAIPRDIVRSAVASDPPPPRVVTSQGVRSSSSTVPQQSTCKPSSAASSSTATGHKVRMATKVSGKGAVPRRGVGRSTSPSLQPPMASVVVERHHPVNKQTIGQATAARFPKTADSDKFQQIAGQGGGLGRSPPVHTVRVVD